MSINRVSISGNLTRDAELRQAGQTPVLRFGVAVNDRAKNQHTGEWEDRPNFVDCVLFGKRADSLSMYLRKGLKVAIDGRLRYSTWQAQDGSNRSKLEVVVDEVEFMSPRGGGDCQQPAPVASAPAASAPAAPAPELYDSDIPF